VLELIENGHLKINFDFFTIFPENSSLLEEEAKMANFKQIVLRFWQNDFVLGLTPEER
jgi:hypothetical protein